MQNEELLENRNSVGVLYVVKRYSYYFIKRFFDLLFSLVGMIFLIPLVVVIKLVTLCSGDTHSIFFKQKRLGKGGNPIYIYKFRTMVPNAEAVLSDWLKNNPEIRDEYYKNRKLDHDPRITKLGNILRKTSLDEFPQFINVFKGDMSLIGPRPIVPDEIENYQGSKADMFLSMRPGLTGYWAANGRSCTTYEERVNLELYYIDHCSLWLDIKIVFQTIVSVIKKEGAK